MPVPHKLAVLLHKLNDAGCGPIRRAGDEFRCRCPAHNDNGPSFYVGLTEDKILARCSAGCTVEAVCDRLDHDVKDLFLDTDELWGEVNSDFTIAVGEAAAPPAATQPAAAPPAESTATADVAAGVYQDLLRHLELSLQHFDDLQGRGLSAQEIERRGYRTADGTLLRKAIDRLLTEYDRHQLLQVPGFVDRDGHIKFAATKGFLIPVRDATGRIVALKVRHDADYSGQKYTWCSSKEVSCGSPVHVPLGVPTPVAVARLTEGELKADVATVRSGMPTISSPGVTNWRLAVPVLKALGAQRVHLAFDQDGKPGTLAAIDQALYGLAREGFDVVLEWWDGKLGKGIDDLLAAERQPQVLVGLDAALRLRDLLAVPAAAEPDAAEPKPEAFPVDVFPPALATYCREVGEATTTPPAFAGQAMLVTAGAALGNSRALCLKPNVWYEGPRLYAANVGDPATGKTPAMDVVVKPYQAVQLRLIREFKKAEDEHARAQAAYDQVTKENRQLADEEKKPVPPVPPEPPEPERFVAVDATVESLAPLLEENPRGLFMPQDEGVAWVRGMGQYKGGKGNDRQFWLSTWSGKSHLVDRKSQGSVPISIPRPFINVICGLPPDMLNELADHQGRNDGFLHRVLFVYPQAVSGAEWTEATVSPASKAAWQDTLVKLRSLKMVELEDGALGYKAVQLSPAAKEVWVAWWDAHAAEIRSPDLPIALIGPWGKLKSYAARLALILHYLWLLQGDQDENDVDVASVERAVRLINYYKSHLRLVYSRLRQTPEDNYLHEVLAWIRQQGGQCRARDLVRAKKATPTEKAKKLLKELEDQGYGRLESREAANGRGVHWFVLDPG